MAKKKPSAKSKSTPKTPSKAIGFTESVEAFLSKASAPVLLGNLYAAVAKGKPRKMLTKTVYRLLSAGRVTRHGSGRDSAFWGPGKTASTGLAARVATTAPPTVAKKSAGVTKKTSASSTRAQRKGGTRPIQAATLVDPAPKGTGTNATRDLLLNIVAKADEKLRARALMSSDKHVRELAQHTDALRKALGSYL